MKKRVWLIIACMLAVLLAADFVQPMLGVGAKYDDPDWIASADAARIWRGAGHMTQDGGYQASYGMISGAEIWFELESETYRLEALETALVSCKSGKAKIVFVSGDGSVQTLREHDNVVQVTPGRNTLKLIADRAKGCQIQVSAFYAVE